MESKGKMIASVFRDALGDCLSMDYGSVDIKLVFHEGKLVRKVISKEVSIKIEGDGND